MDDEQSEEENSNFASFHSEENDDEYRPVEEDSRMYSENEGGSRADLEMEEDHWSNDDQVQQEWAG